MQLRLSPQFTKAPSFGDEEARRSFFDQRTIRGSSGDDEIRIAKRGDDLYEVTINGQSRTFTRDELKNLTIDAGAGNDRIIVEEGVDIAPIIVGGSGDDIIDIYADHVSVDAGDGDDVVVNLGEHNDIEGGAGNDQVFSRGSNNHLRGGSGRDQIVSRGDDNDIDGGGDDDDLSSQGRNNRVHGRSGDDVLWVKGDGNTVLSDLGSDVVTVEGNNNRVWLSDQDAVSTTGENNEVHTLDNMSWILLNYRA